MRVCICKVINELKFLFVFCEIEIEGEISRHNEAMDIANLFFFFIFLMHCGGEISKHPLSSENTRILF